MRQRGKRMWCVVNKEMEKLIKEKEESQKKYLTDISHENYKICKQSRIEVKEDDIQQQR